MTPTHSRSVAATRARDLVASLQRRFVTTLERVSAEAGHPASFEEVGWLRDGGRHGGGSRFEIGDTPIFDRGSVNVSHVHYDDVPDKRLGSATALSTIIHPRHPLAPSIHMHVSWTELRDGSGSWRVMADLNPSIPDDDDTARFRAAVAGAAPEQLAFGMAQGDRYFYIPALGRHRGVFHFYLEGHATADPAADEALARGVIEAAIDEYGRILGAALGRHPEPTPAQREQQLAYHTVYLFQVLTLDRGTTSGLLVHDENDAGIMGSLPSHVDRARLASWRERVPQAQVALVDALVSALPDASPSPVTLAAKLALARAVREHYRAHPEALELQARGDVVPPTVANHS